MIAGCYTLDLYCRHELPLSWGFIDNTIPGKEHKGGEFPHEFTGQTEAECKADARARGWVFNRDGEVTCPRCASVKRRPERTLNYGDKNK